MARAKKVVRRSPSFPRRNRLYWEAEGQLIPADGARGAVYLTSGKKLDLYTGEIY